MKLKINQIAIRVPRIIKATSNLSNIFGAKWDFDNLDMDGNFRGKREVGLNIDLAFNFELMENKFELELITSSDMFHWHQKIIEERGDFPFLSHLGCYVNKDDFEKIIDLMLDLKVKILQETRSYNHTSLRKDDKMLSSRKYIDIVYGTEEMFGFNLKFTTEDKK